MRKVCKLSILLSLTFMFLGCSWELPERFYVKTNASYNFAIGTIEKSLDSELDFKSQLQSNMDGITLYDYFPGKSNKQIQQFVLTVKVFEMDIRDLIADNSLWTSFLAALPSGGLVNFSALPAGLPPLAVSGTQGLDFNPSEIMDSMKETMGSDIADKIEFVSAPVYLYCDAGLGLSANAQVKMYYGKKGGTRIPVSPDPYDFYVVGSSAEHKTVANAALPEMTLDEDTSSIVLNLNDEASSISCDIAEIMNNSKRVTVDDAELCLNYDFVINGEITKESLYNSRISVYVAVVLPLQFKVLDDIEIDLRQFMASTDMGADDDVFGRSGPTGFDDKQKYLDTIRCASLIYTTYALPFIAEPSIQFSTDFTGTGNFEDHDLSAGIITLTYKTVHDMLDTYPLRPNLKIKMVKDCAFSLPRNKDFSMNLSLNVITDGTIQLF